MPDRTLGNATSPVSAIEAIEKAMEGVTHPESPEWIAVAQDGDGPNGGFWTCAAATTESPRYIRADFYSALARQAEALQRENAEKDARIAALEAGVSDLVEIARQHVPSIPPDGPTTAEHQAAYEATGFALVEIRKRARALLGGENAE